MNVLNYGWNAGCVFTETDREYRRICKSAGLPIIDIDAYEPEMDEEEESDNEVVGKVGGGQYVKSIVDFILKPETLFNVNEKPMDEKLIKIDIDETVDDDMASDKLKILTDWERTYLTGCIDSDTLSNKIEEVF